MYKDTLTTYKLTSISYFPPRFEIVICGKIYSLVGNKVCDAVNLFDYVRYME